MEMSDNFTLTFDAFLRSFKQNIDESFAFLLGAGASITSGVPSASECIWDWKKEIYLSQNSTRANYFDIRTESGKEIVQRWLDNSGGFPQRDADNEYVFYVEKAYPEDADRLKYFKGLCHDKKPYIGYKLLCLLSKYGVLKSVWTTNFDGLVERAAHQANITPININLDNSSDITRNDSKNDLLYIALHGDYKYSKLKNTAKELDSQEETFSNRMRTYFMDRNLIVCGYSGRDKSLMSTLKKAFSIPGTGRLYWCGYGENVTQDVKSLLTTIRQNGRRAYYICTDGFDDFMIRLMHYTYQSDPAKNSEIKGLMQCESEEEPKTSFRINTCCYGAIRTNLRPITLPMNIFQFQINVPTGIGKWQYIKEKIKGKHIIAAPYGNTIYALANVSTIDEIFGTQILQGIQRCPITIDEINRNGAIKSMFIKAIVCGISSIAHLEASMSKHIIWDKTKAYQGYQSTFEAVKINLLLDPNLKYGLLSFLPTLYFENDTMSLKTKSSIVRGYLDTKRNENYDVLLTDWGDRIFNGNRMQFDYPAHSDNGFKFKISSAYGVIDIDYTSKGVIPESEYSSQERLYKGILVAEPKLEFLNKMTMLPILEENPMRGLLLNMPYNQQIFAEEQHINIGVICPQSKTSSLFSFISGLNYIQKFRREDSDYVQNFPGFVEAFKCSIQIPTPHDHMWIKCKDYQPNTLSLAQNICKFAKKLANALPNTVVLIFIPKEWEKHRMFNEGGETFDLHNYIKAYAACNQFTTQLIEEKTINNKSMRCEVYWWLSLAIYVKSMRYPWALHSIDENTAYVGLGYSVRLDKMGNPNVVIGCSHVYNSKGQGLRYKLSKIDCPSFDNKRNPYLTYDEAYKFGANIINLFAQSMDRLPKRVVIHKRTPYTSSEIKGITDALKGRNITDIDLITITIEHDIRCTDLSIESGRIFRCNYPVRRGIAAKISDYEFLLWTHGTVDSIRNNRAYYMGGNGVPIPLRVTKHYGNGDLGTISSEILAFTKMNWNSFNYYTKLPATIDTSNTLAQVGNLLRQYEGVTYDYRFFI